MPVGFHTRQDLIGISPAQPNYLRIRTGLQVSPVLMTEDEPDFEAREWLQDDDTKFRVEVGIVGDIGADFKGGDSGEITKGHDTGCESFTKGDVILVSLDCDDVAEGDIIVWVDCEVADACLSHLGWRYLR
jgi:hypothetical protein